MRATALRRPFSLLFALPLVVGAGMLAAPSAAAAAASTEHAGPLAVPAFSSFDPLDNGDPVQVRTLSSRADLVSGGQSLVEVVLPRGTDVRTVKVSVGSRDVTGAFTAGGPGLRGLVTGLPVGTSTITATVPHLGLSRLVVKNAPQGGPVFSGPLITPWTCTNGSTLPDCSQPATVAYFYKSTDPSKAGLPGRVASDPVKSGFHSYDPANPPSDVATTKTDDGNTVPFIVRVETGYSLRDQYKIAALYDPKHGGAPNPTAANPGFNHKLVLAHGTSCDTSYASGTATDVLFEQSLGEGFAVASHALDNAGHNCNIVTEAESLNMVKELVVERYGPLRYTIGSGCSGGSLVQQEVANAYPGMYQGITPQCSFTDAWSSSQQYIDYVALRAYLEDPATFPQHHILPAQWPSIFGHANPANQITFTTAIPNSGNPTRSCPGVPAAQVYSPTNPKGVRCTLQDYMRNVFGVDEAGKARRPLSNVGIQYGLSGLNSYLGANAGDPTRPPLTPDQFVALNAGVGGYDIDFQHIAARTKADPVAQERVYRSGAVDTAAHLDQVAILDLGGPEVGAFHDVYRKYAMRDRLIREHGTSANQVFWEGQTPLLGDVRFAEQAVTAMDSWLQVVESDHRTVPLPQKILDAKAKAGVHRRCVASDGSDAPLQVCQATVDPTIFSSPRIEAGGGDQAPVNGVGPAVVGFTDDRLDCQTMPIEKQLYAGKTFAQVFTPAQQATLKQTFPTGICDYSKPGNGFQASVPWLRYQDDAGKVVYGGVAMGTAPTSIFIPFGASAAAGGGTSGPRAAGRGTSLPSTGMSTGANGLAAGVLVLGLAGLARRRRTAR